MQFANLRVVTMDIALEEGMMRMYCSGFREIRQPVRGEGLMR